MSNKQTQDLGQDYEASMQAWRESFEEAKAVIKELHEYLEATKGLTIREEVCFSETDPNAYMQAFVQARDSLIAFRRERLARAISILRENGFAAEERLSAWGLEIDVTKPLCINLLD